MTHFSQQIKSFIVYLFRKKNEVDSGIMYAYKTLNRFNRSSFLELQTKKNHKKKDQDYKQDVPG